MREVSLACLKHVLFASRTRSKCHHLIFLLFTVSSVQTKLFWYHANP